MGAVRPIGGDIRLPDADSFHLDLGTMEDGWLKIFIFWDMLDAFK